MAIKLRRSSVANTRAKMKKFGDAGTKAARRAMKRKGAEIRELAKTFAPIDTGDLEKAIFMRSKVLSGGGIHVEVNVRNLERDYELHTHEGDYNLGPKSDAKDGGRGVVGRKYLERAFDEIQPSIHKEIEKELNRLIR